ncbi:MAG: hypothetical protein KF688_19700 [Pirellulales bacterium]|nr:hypothetical protein [Pirellulales bacterium]
MSRSSVRSRLAAGGVLVAFVVLPAAGAWGQEVRLPGTWYDQDKHHLAAEAWAGASWTRNYFDDANGNNRFDPGEAWDEVSHPGWLYFPDNSCWAASAANLLRYVGGPDRYHNWVYVAGTGPTGNQFWPNTGAPVDALEADGYATEVHDGEWLGDPPIYQWTVDPTVWFEARFQDTLPVSMNIHFVGSTSHLLTVYAIDRTAQTVVVADSDQDPFGNNFATYSYTWNPAAGFWELQGTGYALVRINSGTTFATNDFIGGGAGGSGSSWNNPANWSAGHAPASNELPKIHFQGLGTVNLDSFAATLKTVLRGQTKLNVSAAGLLRTQTMYVGDTAQIWVDRGVLDVEEEAVNDSLILVLPGAYVEADWMRVGSRDDGAIVQSGGDFSTTVNGGLSLGEQPSVQGAYQILAGRVYAAQLEVGHRGLGAFTHSGGAVLAPLHLHVGDLPGSVGTYSLSGAASSLQAATEFIGREGTGVFNHYEGSNQCDGALWIGHYDNSHGEYYLHAGTLTTVDMEIGGYLNAYGFVRQSGGECVVERDLDMAQFSQFSQGEYRLDGGALRVGRNEIVGGAGTALFVHNGGLHEIGGNLTIGAAPNSSGAYVIQNGTLDVADGSLAVGYNGGGLLQLSGGTVIANRLDIHSGGLVQVATSGNLYADLIDLSVGGSLVTTGPNATILTNGINGLGSSFTVNGNLGVGWAGGSGVGSLTVGSGQSLDVTSVLYLGDSSTGTVTVAGGGQAVINQARVGDHGAGTLVITGNASQVTQQGEFYFGHSGAGAGGHLRIENGGALLGNGRNGFLGVGAGTTGSALVSGANSRWTNLANLYVGGNATGPMGSGVLTVSAGGRVQANSSLQVWNTGRVELSGGEISAGSFLVQNGGAFVHQNGVLTVDGGLFSPGTTYNYSIDGPTASELPTVALKNVASANIPNTLFVGYDHAGELRLESGAVMRSFNGRIGWNAGASDGRVHVAGGHWINTADLEIGVRNRGQMSISGGGVVRNTVGAIAAVAGSTGEVAVASGGEWECSDALYVGGKSSPGGVGTLAISSAEVSATQVTVWPQGRVSLDSGTIQANSVDIEGGVLEGVGSLALDGPLTNRGLVAPGLPIGALTMRGGDFVQSEFGEFSVQIGGNRLVDRLSINAGAAWLDGALHVSLANGYVPPAGNQFEILWAEHRVFDTFDPLLSVFEPIGGGLGWHVDYREYSVVLQVSQTAYLEADFDEDGDVDGADLTMWQGGYGLNANGDANGDGVTDGADFLVWQRQLGSGATSIAHAAGVGYDGVPERRTS